MSIQPVSGSYSHYNDNYMQSVKAEAAIKVTGMVLSNHERQGQDLAKLMNASQIISDPALGSKINILA